MTAHCDVFGAKGTLTVNGAAVTIYRLQRLQELGVADIARLPYSIRVLLENLLLPRYRGRCSGVGELATAAA
jgi:aconitate hydratase